MSLKKLTNGERIEKSDVETLEALSDMMKSKAQMLRSEAEIMNNLVAVSKALGDAYIDLIPDFVKEERNK